MSLVVSVVSHGHAAMLMDLLQDFRDAACAPSEVVVTLNLADEDTAALEALVATLPFACRFIRNATPQGFGANHNQAFTSTRASVFAVLNPDLRLCRDADGRALDPLNALSRSALHQGVGVAAPMVLSPNGEAEDAWRETLTPWRLVKRYVLGQRAAACRPDWAAGMCLVFRAEAFAAVKGFDEAYFMYCEDMDVGLRLRDAGWQTAFCAHVSVIHAAQRASRTRLRHLAWHVKSLLRFWRKRALQ